MPHTRLLIVDDQEDHLELMRIAAQRSGLFASIKTCVTPESAIKLVSESSDSDLPHLVLTDFKMPLLNGAELSRRLLALNRQPAFAIVCVSSSGDPQDAQAAVDAGCKTFLSKPHDWAGMQNLVRTVATYTPNGSA